MQRINLYTDNYFFHNRLKYYFKKLTGKVVRGPFAVIESLKIGLNNLNIDYSLNCKNINSLDTACVISNYETLEWAIQQKKQGSFKRIIAGPNIAVTPKDYNALLKNKLIDKILVPSQWVMQFYISMAPDLLEKISIWPAGVSVPQKYENTKSLDFLVYKKNIPENLFLSIIKILKEQKFSYKIINYGTFKRSDYFEDLSKSKYLIYLSASESQGLAMFEAWARNVPVIAWEPGIYTNDNITINSNVASPFLEDINGKRFLNEIEFRNVLENLTKSIFQPREFILQNFTHNKTTENYIKIVYDL